MMSEKLRTMLSEFQKKEDELNAEIEKILFEEASKGFQQVFFERQG